MEKTVLNCKGYLADEPTMIGNSTVFIFLGILDIHGPNAINCLSHGFTILYFSVELH